LDFSHPVCRALGRGASRGVVRQRAQDKFEIKKAQNSEQLTKALELAQGREGDRSGTKEGRQGGAAGEKEFYLNLTSVTTRREVRKSMETSGTRKKTKVLVGAPERSKSVTEGGSRSSKCGVESGGRKEKLKMRSNSPRQR